MHTRSSALWAALAAALTCALFLQTVERGQAAGDGGERAGLGSARIGLLDVERAVDHCTARSGAFAALARDRREFDDELASQRAKAKELANRMAKTPAGAQERYQMEGRLRAMAKQALNQTDQKNREFTQRDTQLRLDAYWQVRQAVAGYAADHHLRLVLRHSARHADPNGAAALEEVLASPVFYHDALDITDEVLKALDASHSALGVTPIELGGAGE